MKSFSLIFFCTFLMLNSQRLFAQSTNIDSIKNTATLLYQDANFAGARIALGKIIDLDPSNPEALRSLALIAYRQGNIEVAISYFNKILERNWAFSLGYQLYAETLFSLGLISFQQNRLEDASNYFNRIVAVNPNEEQALFNLGIIASRLEQREEAIVYFQRSLRSGNREAGRILREHYENFDFMHIEDVDVLPRIILRGREREINKSGQIHERFDFELRRAINRSELFSQQWMSSRFFLRLEIDKNGRLISTFLEGSIPDLDNELKSILENMFEFVPARYQGMNVGVSGWNMALRFDFRGIPRFLWDFPLPPIRILPSLPMIFESLGISLECDCCDLQADRSGRFADPFTPPEFPGGVDAMFQFLRENTVFPEEARNRGFQGTVFMHFRVTKDGSVTNVHVVRGVGGGLDEEAIRVVQSMPRWTPATQFGEPICTPNSIPIRFTLEM